MRVSIQNSAPIEQSAATALVLVGAVALREKLIGEQNIASHAMSASERERSMSSLDIVAISVYNFSN